MIHTVGPVWQGGHNGEAELLESCYRTAFKLAQQHQLRSIAFPGISTGVYGFPKQQACRIALQVMLDNEPAYERIIACCFSAGDVVLYQTTLDELRQR